MERILVIEDEVVIRRALSKLLQRKGYAVFEAGSVAEGEVNHSLDSFHLIIADLRLPGGLGTEVIGRSGETPVLIMTSYASISSAVDSMKAGAADYIAKPFNHDEILIVTERLIRQNVIFRQNRILKREIKQTYPVSGMVGDSNAMKQVFSRIEKVAATDSTVLIYGESGTGKELVARAIHEQGARKSIPLVTMNCAAIPDSLIESELFGYEKGAFTGAEKSTQGLIESADNGTLFLDEVAELSPSAQAGLLRVLQEGELRRLGSTKTKRINVRVLAATHRDLVARVGQGRFRDDLLYRLKVIEIALPPLRNRKDDLPALAEHLLQRTRAKRNSEVQGFSPGAVKKMSEYDWPGNVRELENAIERALILCEGSEITPDLLNLEKTSQNFHQDSNSTSSKKSLDEYFVTFVRQHESAMNETELARELGISRKTLWERRQRFGIPRNLPDKNRPE